MNIWHKIIVSKNKSKIKINRYETSRWVSDSELTSVLLIKPKELAGFEYRCTYPEQNLYSFILTTKNGGTLNLSDCEESVVRVLSELLEKLM